MAPGQRCPAYMARCASSLPIILLLPPTDSQVQLARAGGFVQQQQKEQVNGRQAEVGSCTAAVRLVAEAVVYTSSPLHHPPVKSDPALAARGYKTHHDLLTGSTYVTAGKRWIWDEGKRILCAKGPRSIDL